MAEIFYNTEIFDGYRDYALGGFRVEDDNDINFTTVYSAVEDKIEALIEDYVLRCFAANNFDTNMMTRDDAMLYIGVMIKDYLNTYPQIFNAEGLQESIMNSDQMQRWLYVDIKDRIKKYPYINVQFVSGVPNEATAMYGRDEQLYQEAVDATDNMTLEQYLEQLSLIEL
jgi:hypothetical protein